MKQMSPQTKLATPFTVFVDVHDKLLNRLLRGDLASAGFDVRGSLVGQGEIVDVVVGDDGGPFGGRLTVRVSPKAIVVMSRDGTSWFPATELDRLANLLQAELEAVKDRR